ncbi:type III pantothenate kinase [uncultured Microscilla sp.]|uniref:type III pantothenate kinase n=1 Tax=uncultured Microscilla sp. TaxID=432653 RepID=UPI0026363F94|nr:type III pantothenate kinase [uncultured Microscilla sp.]
MLLAVDIGNSNIVLGLYDQNEWMYHWRLQTITEKSASEYEMNLRTYFLEQNLAISDVNHIALSSVVPELIPIVRNMLWHLFGKEPLVVTPEVIKQLPVGVQKPHEIGSDLVANAVAGYDMFKDNCIVVDFGTALTFTTVSTKGNILGVAIAPGLKTSIYALYRNTAKLPDIEIPLELPDSAIGKNTEHALQAGVLLGYVGLVEHLIAHIRQELGGNCKVVATGGLSSVIIPLKQQFDAIEPMLTMDGLRLINEYILG